MTEHERLLALSADFVSMAERAVIFAEKMPSLETKHGMCGMAGAFRTASKHCLKLAAEIAPHATN